MTAIQNALFQVAAAPLLGALVMLSAWQFFRRLVSS